MSERPQNKNLKPVPKGVSGNPGGVSANRLTRAKVEKVMSDFAHLNRDELQGVIKDKKSTILQIMVASVMIKAIAGGDASRLAFLLDRSIGRVPQPKEVEETPETGEDPDNLWTFRQT